MEDMGIIWLVNQLKGIRLTLAKVEGKFTCYIKNHDDDKIYGNIVFLHKTDHRNT